VKILLEDIVGKSIGDDVSGGFGASSVFLCENSETSSAVGIVAGGAETRFL
jgi:hypothetical protein